MGRLLYRMIHRWKEGSALFPSRYHSIYESTYEANASGDSAPAVIYMVERRPRSLSAGSSFPRGVDYEPYPSSCEDASHKSCPRTIYELSMIKAHVHTSITNSNYWQQSVGSFNQRFLLMPLITSAWITILSGTSSIASSKLVTADSCVCCDSNSSIST